jgi:hypothetical protein
MRIVDVTDIADPFNIDYHDGWSGPFTRQQSPLAKFTNGARIIKAKSEDGDSTANGVEGIILGSIGTPQHGVGYFVEWDNKPRAAVFVVEWKIDAAT